MIIVYSSYGVEIQIKAVTVPNVHRKGIGKKGVFDKK